MEKWMVSSNFIGRMVYQVFRKIDETQCDHSGNREYYHQVFESEKEAQAMADKLNNEELYQVTKQYYGSDSEVIFKGSKEECLKEFNFIKDLHLEEIVKHVDTPFCNDLVAFKNRRKYVVITLEEYIVEDEDFSTEFSFYYKEV